MVDRNSRRPSKWCTSSQNSRKIREMRAMWGRRFLTPFFEESGDLIRFSLNQHASVPTIHIHTLSQDHRHWQLPSTMRNLSLWSGSRNTWPNIFGGQHSSLQQANYKPENYRPKTRRIYTRRSKVNEVSMGEAAGKFFKNGRVSAVGVITVSSPRLVWVLTCHRH